MRKFLLISVLFFTTLSFGQFEAIDTKMDEMPDSLESSTTSIANYISENFTTDDDKIRAVFYWTAATISYDVENMFNQRPNQTVDYKIKTTLETKKGVCMHYAEVFKDIANKVGLKTVIIDGYTKQDGKIVTTGHSWNASKIYGTWYLFDPTWGSGYVNNQHYFRKLNNDFFKADVVQFGLSHMPFDYLWQLKEYPISNQEFYDSKTLSESTTVKFDFNSEIKKDGSLSNIERVIAVINRVEKGGLINNLIIEKIAMSKKEIDYFKETEAIAKLEIIVPQFNEATKQLNEFIYFRNHKFLPAISDEELKNKFQLPYDLITKYQEEVSKIIVSKENASNLNSLKKAISATKLIADNQQVFLKEYLAKNTADRAKMFIKVITIKK
jgi:hypothetical protein